MSDAVFLSQDLMAVWLRNKMKADTPYHEMACYSVALNLLGIPHYWADHVGWVSREKYLDWLNRTITRWELLNHPIQGFAEFADAIHRGEFDIHD